MAVAVAMAVSSFSHTASATIWDITTVQTGTDSGFGFSSFHAATPGSPMSGANLANITGMGSLGHYNDMTGEFTATFDLGGDSTVSLATQLMNRLMFVGMDGPLLAPALLEATFGGTPIMGLTNDTIGFMSGFVCCGNGGDAPNSFHINPDGSAVMTLWGGNGFNIPNETYPDTTFGMDLRITMVAYIPEPMSAALFGFGLVGLRLVRRRSSR